MDRIYWQPQDSRLCVWWALQKLTKWNGVQKCGERECCMELFRAKSVEWQIWWVHWGMARRRGGVHGDCNCVGCRSWTACKSILSLLTYSVTLMRYMDLLCCLTLCSTARRWVIHSSACPSTHTTIHRFIYECMYTGAVSPFQWPPQKFPEKSSFNSLRGGCLSSEL